MRSEWKEKRLGDVVSITGGGTPSRSVAAFWNGNIPWATVKDFVGLELAGTKERITDEGLKKSASNLIPAGRVIIPTRMALGKAAINAIPMAINQDLKALECSKALEPKYLLRWLLSNATMIDRMGSGATVKGITLDQLTSLTIPLPPLSEQRRIAAILDKADGIRRKRREAIHLLDDFLRATFLDMFGDPVTNPKGWEMKRLPEFYINPKDGTKCGPFGSALKKGELVDSGVPVWNMDNIGPMGEMILPFRMWITPEKYFELETYSVVDGDILISRAGTVGKMCVASMNGQRGIINTNLIRLRLGPKLLPTFFVSLMLYCGARIGRLRTGSDGAFTHMNTSILDSLEFPYPPRSVQRRFVEIVQTVEKQKGELTRHSAESESLFVSLQSRAFKGEL